MTYKHSLGIITHPTSSRKDDYLYRISLKGLIKNKAGEVLVVKETGRDWWDLPGGGMDHGEDMTVALARELEEEVNLRGEFTHKILAVDEPSYLEVHDFWQVRLIFQVIPENVHVNAGVDGDEIAFVDPTVFRDSHSSAERSIYRYSLLASQ